MKEKLKEAIDRYEHINAQLSDPEITKDSKKLKELSQERAGLNRIVQLGQEYLDCLKRFDEAHEMIEAGGELSELAQEESKELKSRLNDLEKEIQWELLPKDPNEGRNIILEIRAGAGGEEASLFAADLLRMYLRFSSDMNWQVEVLNESFSDQGGYKEVSIMISGKDVYRALKYESGVHRVQRIPTTEAGGRIHTSTVTVAVLPEADEAEVEVKEQELRIDVFRASGKGGQGVNTTDSAVRITHLPTGTVVVCQDERSQIKNKAKAMKVLRARLLDTKIQQQEQELAADRRSQVGSGDRSERIRTYNFPQERVTDHRIGLNLKKLKSVLEGNLQEMIEKLQQDDYSKRLGNNE